MTTFNLEKADLCLECSTFTLFTRGLKKICHTCQEAVEYRRKTEMKK